MVVPELVLPDELLPVLPDPEVVELLPVLPVEDCVPVLPEVLLPAPVVPEEVELPVVLPEPDVPVPVVPLEEPVLLSVVSSFPARTV